MELFSVNFEAQPTSHLPALPIQPSLPVSFRRSMLASLTVIAKSVFALVRYCLVILVVFLRRHPYYGFKTVKKRLVG